MKPGFCNPQNIFGLPLLALSGWINSAEIVPNIYSPMTRLFLNQEPGHTSNGGERQETEKLDGAAVLFCYLKFRLEERPRERRLVNERDTS